MIKRAVLASQVSIKVDGIKLQPQIADLVQELLVDQHAYLPNMFTIRLYDQELQLLDKGSFDLGKEVEINGDTDDGKSICLIKGEVTALEPHFDEDMMSYLIVRGFDISHRLFRETKSRAFLNIKDSDIAQQIAASSGLQAQVDATHIVYEHLYQDNQSDLSFLMQRAWRIGYECYVDGKTLYFKKPAANLPQATLSWGEQLLSFYPHITIAEQVDEVIVRSWDPETQKPIIGRARQGDLYPLIAQTNNGTGSTNSLSRGKRTIVDECVMNQAEADILAQARLDEFSGAFIEAEGTALRHPDIRAGRAVKLENLGQRLNGTYLVTSATHTFTEEGLKTTFSVRGLRTGLLRDQIMPVPTSERWSGVVIAIVTNTNDPKRSGRVKLKFPWMSENVESAWARVLGIGAGSQAGHYAIPQVDDEVLVIFEHGHFDRPVVLGGIWNTNQHKIPAAAAKATGEEQPLVRSWCSPKGHQINFYDTGKNNMIEINSAGGHTLILNDNTGKIEIKSHGTLSIESKTNLDIKAGGSLSLKANGEVSVKGKVIKLN